MEHIEVSPGLYVVEMSDEERRARYALSDEMMTTLYSERDIKRLTRSDSGVVSKLRTVGEHILFGPPRIKKDIDMSQFATLISQEFSIILQDAPQSTPQVEEKLTT